MAIRSIRRLKRLIFARPLITLVVVILVALVAFGIHRVTKKTPVISTIPSTNVQANNSQPDQSQASDSTNSSSSSNATPPPTSPPKSEATASTDPNATLLDPSGTFVSYHQPSLSQNTAPSKETSSCHTTAGASCTITFTKDGDVKSLTAQKTDAKGNTFWEWDVKDAGFTVGTWKIKAIATLGNQTKTAVDTVDFEVHP